jgi:ubiquinone/menaquinone biosynthesis C-methylase UbiE
MSKVSQMWASPAFVRTVGASYDWAMAHPPAARRFARVVLGADVDRVYRAMDAIAEMPDGAAVLDVPCGSGIAMLRLRPDRGVRYVGVDISVPMLHRARRRIPAVHRDRVEIVEANIERMPFSDGEFDLCVSFNGLHCVPDPAAAVAEMGRCLRAGGRLVGEFAVRGQLRRADAYMAVLRATGTFGAAGAYADAQRWLNDAGLVIDALECDGAIAHFEATRPA